MPNVIFYIRASTGKQVITEEVQRQLCKGWFEREAPEGAKLVGELIDKGVSGGTDLFDRPQGKHILTELGEGDILVTAKLSRAFRSTSNAYNSLQILNKLGIKMVMLDLPMDIDTPYGKAMFGMMAIFAELEREMIAERTREALQSKIAEGVWLGPPPAGWASVPKDKAENASRLKPDNAIREIGALAAQEIAAGVTDEEVAFQLSRACKGRKFDNRRDFDDKKWFSRKKVVTLAVHYLLGWPMLRKKQVIESLGENPYSSEWIRRRYEEEPADS